MRKSYIIYLEGDVQERLEELCSNGLYSFTGIVRVALTEYFKKIDKERKIIERNENRNK